MAAASAVQPHSRESPSRRGHTCAYKTNVKRKAENSRCDKKHIVGVISTSVFAAVTAACGRGMSSVQRLSTTGGSAAGPAPLPGCAPNRFGSGRCCRSHGCLASGGYLRLGPHELRIATFCYVWAPCRYQAASITFAGHGMACSRCPCRCHVGGTRMDVGNDDLAAVVAGPGDIAGRACPQKVQEHVGVLASLLDRLAR
jgi:hypothetical protein